MATTEQSLTQSRDRSWFRPRFRLKTLLALAVVFALVCAWLRAEYRDAQERAEYVQRFYYDHGYCLRASTFLDRSSHDPKPISWIRRVLRQHPIGDLLYHPELDRDGSIVRRVQELFPEADIRTLPDSKAALPPGVRRLAPGVRIMIHSPHRVTLHSASSPAGPLFATLAANYRISSRVSATFPNPGFFV